MKVALDIDGTISEHPEFFALVCKVRNGGNFDFVRQRWLSTSRLTELIR